MSPMHTWVGIAAIVVTSTAGDVLLAKGMRQIGDLGALRRERGIGAVVRNVVANAWFLFGLAFMAASFFALLVTLSWADVSLVAPASASLTFVTNAVAAKLFLNENVDARRWAAALCVCAGVVLLAI